MAKKVVYSEPASYFPKEIREKYFGESADGKKKPAAKKSAATAKKKVKRK